MTKAMDYLKAIPQWVAYTGGRKVPMGVDGRPASSTNPDTWMSHDEAVEVARTHGFAGVGFVMSHDDDLVGVDLDNAIDESGRVKPWAWEVVQELGSYTEVSPSGRGLHIWVRGRLPAGGSRIKVEDGLLEVYESARYFTVTEMHLPRTPTSIFAHGKDLAGWYFKHFPSRPPSVSEPREIDVEQWIQDALDHIPAEDYDVWTRVGMGLKDELGESAFELWRQWSATSSKYEGDQKLHRKWQSFGGEGYTIGTVIMYAQQNGFEIPTPNADDILPGTNDFWDNYTTANNEEEQLPHREWVFDAAELQALESTREYLIEPKVAGPSDMVVMAGPPKSMKSFITLDMLTHFSQGLEWHGIKPVKPLRTLVLNLELHHEAVGERLKVLRSNPESGMLYITMRLREKMGKRGAAEIAKLADEVGGFDLLVVDPIANWFDGESENDNSQMVKFLAELNMLRAQVGEETILWLVHHSRKASQAELEGNPFNSFRGASSLRGYYDTGIAVWRKRDKSIGMDFELRNGHSPERLHLEFAEGVFGLSGSAADRHTEDQIMDAILSDCMPDSKSKLSEILAEEDRKIRGEDSLSSRQWNRKLNDAAEAGKLTKLGYGAWQWEG